MEIQLAPEVRIRNAQEQFQKRFPFLRIEFFKNKPGMQIRPESRLDSEMTFAAAGLTAPAGVVQVTGLMKVRELEKMISTSYGIHAEIFRKSGRVWLRTTATDDWTLDEQNREARESGIPEPGAEEYPDYHEQE